ncbi:hypothetical protein FB451DRAFT_1384290 [Mycena latifolia]|nr:hypothetical protein FB451DRAFT_1384290 [Mycena latifolia]
MRNRYDVSKTLLLMFAKEFAARLPKDAPVSIMSVNLGFCHSRLTRETESRLFGKLLVGTLKQFVARPTEAGSRTILHAVATPDPETFHGQYITNCAISGESDFLATPDSVRLSVSLWREMIQVLEKADPRFGGIINAHLAAA